MESFMEGDIMEPEEAIKQEQSILQQEDIKQETIGGYTVLKELIKIEPREEATNEAAIRWSVTTTADGEFTLDTESVGAAANRFYQKQQRKRRNFPRVTLGSPLVQVTNESVNDNDKRRSKKVGNHIGKRKSSIQNLDKLSKKAQKQLKANVYRTKMTEKTREKYNEQCRIRMQKYRQRIKLKKENQLEIMSKEQQEADRKEQEVLRKEWRTYKKNYRKKRKDCMLKEIETPLGKTRKKYNEQCRIRMQNYRQRIKVANENKPKILSKKEQKADQKEKEILRERWRTSKKNYREKIKDEMLKEMERSSDEGDAEANPSMRAQIRAAKFRVRKILPRDPNICVIILKELLHEKQKCLREKEEDI